MVSRTVPLQRFKPSLWLSSNRSFVPTRSLWYPSTTSSTSSQTRLASNSHLSRRSPIPRPSPSDPLSTISPLRHSDQDYWIGPATTTTSHQTSTSDKGEGLGKARNEGSLGEKPQQFLQQRFLYFFLYFFLHIDGPYPYPSSFRFLHRHRPPLFLLRTPFRHDPHSKSSRQDQEAVETVGNRNTTSSTSGIEGSCIEVARRKGKGENVDQGIENVELK